MTVHHEAASEAAASKVIANTPFKTERTFLERDVAVGADMAEPLKTPSNVLAEIANREAEDAKPPELLHVPRLVPDQGDAHGGVGVVDSFPKVDRVAEGDRLRIPHRPPRCAVLQLYAREIETFREIGAQFVDHVFRKAGTVRKPLAVLRRGKLELLSLRQVPRPIGALGETRACMLQFRSVFSWSSRCATCRSISSNLSGSTRAGCFSAMISR